MSENTVQSREPAKPGMQAPGGNGGIPQFLVDLAKNAPAMMWVFTGTTFLSALLLFAIQPMFAKMVLPVLGGSPSVWSVSVFFFQARAAGRLHLRALSHQQGAAASDRHHPSGRVRRGLRLSADRPVASGGASRRKASPISGSSACSLASIGLPFMAVSANAPLLQAWFARSGHPNARDPYFMYAASNLGSLIALLGYPFVLEPAFGLSQLSHIWAYGFVLLVISIATSFFLMRGAQVGGVPETPGCTGWRAGCHCSAADAAAAPGLGWACVRAGRAGDRFHRARHHRRGIGAAAVGDPAGALPADLRAGVPRQPADRARVAAVPASHCAGGGADHAVADPA